MLAAVLALFALTVVEETDEIMVVTQNGIVSRIKAADVSRQGRPATGVRIQNLMDNDSVMAVNKIVITETNDSVVDVDKVEEVIDASVQQRLDEVGGEANE